MQVLPYARNISAYRQQYMPRWEPKNHPFHFYHFISFHSTKIISGPTIGWRGRTSRLFSAFGRKKSNFWDNWFKNTIFEHLLPEIINFSCFLSFYPICVPKRATFLLWTSQFMMAHSKVLFSKWPPMLEKIWPFHSRIYKTDPHTCKN